MIIFETSRLVIRQLCQGDLPGFHAMQSNPTVMQYVTGDVATVAENRADLDKCIANYSKPGNDFWVWAVVRKSDHALVGTCAIVGENIVGDNAHDHEIGYRFLESEWGQGYGKEVCHALIDYGMNDLQLPSIVANVDRRNLASVKILDASKLQLAAGQQNPHDSCDLVYRWRRTGVERAD